MTLRLTPPILALACLSLLSACSGSGLAGVEGTGGSQQGDVSGFGSIIVNGVAINTNRAEFIINGAAGSEDDVKLGHTVAIETFANGSARKVTVDRRVDGPLDSVDFAEGTASALSQPIRVTATTRYENTDFTNTDSSSRGILNPSDNDLVAVSGFIDADGVLVATLFRRATQSYQRETFRFDVDGTVAELNTATNQFSLGSLTVDYSAANISGELANGVTVEAIGKQPSKNGKLEAESVTVKPSNTSNAGNTTSFSGFVSEATSELQFVIDGIQINTREAKRQDNSSETLVRNSFVRVSGVLEADGSLTASTFSVVPLSGVGYTANVETGQNNTLKIYGITAELSGSTTYQDNSSVALRKFNQQSINGGDKLNITGYYDRDNQFTATVVERLENESTDSVRGTVEGCDALASSFTISKVTITVSSNTRYQNEQGEDITGKEEFCASVSGGQIVTAFGNQSSNTLTASKVRLSR